METLSEKVGEVTVLTPQGHQLDGSNSKAFGRDVVAMVPAGAKVVLDMNRLQYIDSGGCGAILTLLRHVKSTGDGDLKVCGLNPPVRMLFELVRIHALLDVFNTREEALKAYRI